MAITLNHTIVPARDKVAAARFFAGIFGLRAGVARSAHPYYFMRRRGHRSRSGSRASRAGPIRPASCFCVCATSLLDAALSFDAKCPFGFSTGYPAASLVNLADPYPIGGLAMLLLVSSKHRCHRSRVRGCTRLRLMWPSSYARSIARRRKQRRARRSW